MAKYLAAVIQMDSQDDKQKNLEAMKRGLAEAAERGAAFAAMPETSNYIGRGIREAAEAVPGGETCELLSGLAKEYGMWIHGGSIYETNEANKPYNCSMLFAPDGTLAAKYRKLHPFDVQLADGLAIRESDRNLPGDRIVTVDTGAFGAADGGTGAGIGTLGLSICYDLRFSELFKLMALKGAEVLVVPANFTASTGSAHWETLLRARAIENCCYVIAPGQTGQKPKYKAYGNSMIIDPWGRVLARAGEETGVIFAEIDTDEAEKVRKQLFVFENRRTDLYELKELVPER